MLQSDEKDNERLLVTSRIVSEKLSHLLFAFFPDARLIEHLMSVSGKSRATIYYYARKLGRMPTADELTAEHKKTGRPRKKWR